MTRDNHDDSPPYVSFVLTGRNDGYGGDFVARFLATLQFNSRELIARGVAHEFVLVEWAPTPGAPLLADLVDAHCPSSVTAAFRTVVVDPAYHDAVMLNPRLKYQEYLAKNVGVRRARGEYVITTNCDIFFGRTVLERLERRELQPSVLYRAPRWDLKERGDLDRIDWVYLEDPASLSGRARTIRPPLFSGGAGDFIALDRRSFERLRGFNEVYRVVRIAIDGNLVVKALACGLQIVDIGGPVYHLDHAGSYRSSKADYSGREADAPYGDERWPVDTVVYQNRSGWGFADAPERPAGPRRSYLDFDWVAVPPLVDLSAIIGVSEQRSRMALSGWPPAEDRRAVEASPAGPWTPSDAASAASELENLANTLGELRAVVREAAQRVEQADSVLSEAKEVVRRRRRKAEKMASKRPKSDPPLAI